MKLVTTFLAVALVCPVTAGVLLGEEVGDKAGPSSEPGWFQWRGPDRNSSSPSSPALVDKLSEQGLPKLWESEALSGKSYGSVVSAGGRAFVQSYLTYKEPIEPRLLTAKALTGLGWAPDLPEDLVKAVEEARVSEERAKVKGWKETKEWVSSWIKKHEKPEWKKFRNIIKARLSAGSQALPLETLAKLKDIQDKEFASQAELDAWFEAKGFDEAVRKGIMKAIPTTKTLYADLLYCLDMASGKTIWKQQKPGSKVWQGAHPTLCVYGDHCYMFGSSTAMFCLDVKDGKEIWKSEILGREGAAPNSIASSPLWVDDTVVVITETNLAALDAATGEIRWRQAKVKGRDSSPAFWRTKGKTYVICHDNKKLSCVDLSNGEVVWSVRGTGSSCTPTIVNNHAVISGAKAPNGLLAYKLFPDKAEKMWTTALFTDDYSAPLVHEGHVYAIGGGYKKKAGQAVCVELATGKEVWKQEIKDLPHFSSPVFADGKVIAQVGSWLYLLKASQQAYALLGKAKVAGGKYSSPALTGGKLLLRSKRVTCYDLAKQ